MKQLLLALGTVLLTAAASNAQVVILGSDENDHATRMVYTGKPSPSPMALTATAPMVARPNVRALIVPNHENDTVHRSIWR